MVFQVLPAWLPVRYEQSETRMRYEQSETQVHVPTAYWIGVACLVCSNCGPVLAGEVEVWDAATLSRQLS